jgi:peptidoglycan hydrolase CwlO-like protein
MRVKRLFEVAAEEADRLNDSYISTEHLFLAVVADRTGASARILNQFGIEHEKVNNAIWHIRNAQGSPSDSAEDSTADRQRATPADTTSSELHTVHTQIASLEKQTGSLREDVNRLVGSLREDVDRLDGVPAGMIMLKQQIAGLREHMQSLEQKVDELLNLVRGEKPDA